MNAILISVLASSVLSTSTQQATISTVGQTKLSPIPAGAQPPLPQGLHSISKMRIPKGQLENYRRAIATNTHFEPLQTSIADSSGTLGASGSLSGFMSTPGGGDAFSSRVAKPKALVLYDSRGQYGFVGNIYARQMAALVRTTNRSVDIAPVENYVAGTIKKYNQTFYLGTEYDNPLPEAFKSDVLATTKNVCWCGYNLWQIAWLPDWSGDNPTFKTKFGFHFTGIDTRDFDNVLYKDRQVTADPYAAGLGGVVVNNKNKATVLAQASTKQNKKIPYAIKGAKLYYFADNPLADGSLWTSVPRTFVFEDVMHDIVDDAVLEDHPAVLRIEDVHAEADPQMLRAIADFLYAENVPYVVCVIPHYRDPLGYWNYGTPKDESINDKPELVAALQYMAAHGGEIIMHGDTHQYDDVSNPGSGVSGDDYEFFRVLHDENGQEVNYGPAYEDSPAWVNGRLDEGMAILKQAGFTPTGWNTPHYLASPVDYQAFQQRYKYSFCRGKNFSIDAAGYLYMLEQEPCVPIIDDFGMYRFPETLGYVSTPDLGVKRAEPQNMINRSTKVNMVRNGWAGCFFHWFLPVTMLQDLVHGLKGEGYHFVAPNGYYATASSKV